MTLPSQLQGGTQSYTYNPLSGFLSQITDHDGRPYGFINDAEGRQTQVSVPGVIENRVYNGEGQLTSRSKSGGDFSLSESFQYDSRGKITRVDTDFPTLNRTYLNHYSGMGALIGSITQANSGAFVSAEMFEMDGFGNTLRKRRDSGSGFIPEWTNTLGEEGRVTDISVQQVDTNGQGGAFPDVMIREYDDAGNMDISGRTQQSTDALGVTSSENDHLTLSRNYYGVDGKLRFSQRYLEQRVNVNTSRDDGAWEEYYYDALGRRILVRTRQDDSGLCDQGPSDCVSAVLRTVWSGSQVLGEFRTGGAAGDNLSNLADTGGTAEDFGIVTYVHGPGIDQPLALEKNHQTLIIPHANYQGTYVTATDIDGDKDDFNIRFPGEGLNAFLDPSTASSTSKGVWAGSLIQGQADQSGLLYRRNRYYDPLTGQFTQSDPIGLAGGVNLYGYAGGDPVNLSDPFGLCPRCREGGDLVAGFTPGVSTGVDAITLATGVNPITGDRVGKFGRAVAFVGLVTPLSGASLRGLGRVGKFFRRSSGAATNPVPETFARVIGGVDEVTTLGQAGKADVFVTAADDIAGITDPVQLANRLGIDPSDSFTIIEFSSSGVDGIASPILRQNPGFVGGGLTSGGAREFVIPNGPLPSGAIIR